jgi:hypothetical protein
MSLALCGCTRHADAPVPERPGAEPTGFGPVVIVEAPPQPTSCQAATPSGSQWLIPQAAQWLVRIGPAQLLSSAAWSLIESGVQGNEVSKLFAGFRECGIEPEQLHDIWLGFETINEDFVLIVHGPGVGRPQLATCALQAMNRAIPGDRSVEVGLEPSGSTPHELGGLTMIPFESASGYLLNPDEIVLATGAWQHEVGRLAQCMGRPALESHAEFGLAPLITRVDTSADVWGIGTLPPSMVAVVGMLGLPATGPLDLILTVGLSGGLRFEVSLTVDSAASAEQGRATLAAAIADLAASGAPVLEQLGAQLVVEADGPALLVRGWLSVEQLVMLGDKN